MRDFVQQQFGKDELRLSHRKVSRPTAHPSKTHKGMRNVFTNEVYDRKVVELLRARRPARGWVSSSVNRDNRSDPVARYVWSDVIDHVRRFLVLSIDLMYYV